MSRPVVAIVGRPNVGKSTLFNTLAGERISIVKDTPGVTRDRIYADVTWLNYNFTLIDTGGIEPDSGDVILSQMREQAEIAIATADVIMFITDVRQGLQDADAKVADMLRRSKKPVVLVVNKVDSFEKFMPDVYEFYNLGIGEPYPVSASSMLGLGDMLDEVVKYFPEGSENQPEDERPKLLILDEPLDGLDPVMRKQIWTILMSEVAERRTTVLVSSHNLRELEDVCDHVGIMNHGKVIIERSLFDLHGNISKIQVACQTGMPKLPKEFEVLHMSNSGRVYTMIVKGNPREVAAAIQTEGDHLAIVDILPLTLEEIFIYEMGGLGYEVKDILF